ncbi:sigma-70 family RNA polymerase sigma factor [Chitinophaga sp. Ak27]|uniref:sigma-70 family RNA polymerase sigma factor n=1 Tax=Chitinophaga sp. Ak27 TaxID=2726116 RepID=UPI00145DB9B9|nr:sigma-70 family RNA polymerase sigma factor [Chitinophaga sp. Ak27]NLU93412.1 sigma-70 family RNA polymerase sigma factor [Chitinophaga sp. Ak27]
MSAAVFFIKLYNVNYQKVYDFSYKLCGDPHRAKDITQQCFLRLWEKIDTIDSSQEDIFPLLFVIAKRVVIDESRRANTSAQAYKDILHTSTGSVDETVTNIDYKQLKHRLSNILQLLPDKPRTVYEFRDSGYSHKEIAAMLNISVTTVRTHLKTATHFIRKRIGNTTVILVGALALWSCRKGSDGPSTPTGPVTTAEVNRWILDSMQWFYYWKDGLPGSPDASSEAPAYFNSLKNAADRFSFLYDPAVWNTYPASIRSVYGMEVTVVSDDKAPGGALGIIQLVQPGSPAASKGLTRGQLFTRINSQILSTGNAATLLSALVKDRKGQLIMADKAADGKVTETTEQLVTGGGITEEPAVQQSLILTGTPQPTAYLCFNYFDDLQSAALLQAFNTYHQQGIQHLVIDLRYSPGGSVAMAAVLCALASNHIKPTDIFAQYSGNSRLGNRSITFERAMALPEQGTPVSFEQVWGLQLPLNKVYILTGAHTASAAEMVVNSLKPYVTVIQIGGTTLGKDEGMITITDTRNPKRIPWVLMPITYKLLNATGAGGYHQGLAPAYPVDELASLPLQPLGNTSDPLLAKALQLIGAPGGRITHTAQNAPRQYITPGAMAYPVMVTHP